MENEESDTTAWGHVPLALLDLLRELSAEELPEVEVVLASLDDD